MGVSSSQASLQAVRQDLDLSAAGGMTERAVRNKVNNQSGDISLESFKGNVLGQQLLIDKSNWSGGSWQRKRYHSSAHSYATISGGDVKVSGDQIIVKRTARGNNGDAAAEARVLGRVNEAGTYRLTGTINPEFYSRDSLITCEVLLLCNRDNYLSGTQVILTNLVFTRSNSTSGADKAVDQTVNLSLNYPYVTLILRNVSKNGSQPTGAIYNHKFFNFKLVKV